MGVSTIFISLRFPLTLRGVVIEIIEDLGDMGLGDSSKEFEENIVLLNSRSEFVKETQLVT